MPKNDNNLPVYNPRLPQIYDNPNVKVLNVLDDIISPEAGEQLTFDELMVGKEDKQPVRVPVKVYYLPVSDLDQDENIKLKQALQVNKKFSEFDRAVFGAIVSLAEAGNKYMTPSTIYRLMVGSVPSPNDSKEEKERKAGLKVHPKVEEEIRVSIRKMRQIFTIIDYTEQARLYPDLNIQKCVIDDYMLSGSIAYVLAGGSEVWALKLHEVPALYNYAKKLHQIISIRPEFLEVGGDNNSSRIAVRMYLLRRILANTHKMSSSILYSTLYEVVDANTNLKKSRLRDFVHSCLNDWVTLGLIAGYNIRPHERNVLNKFYAIDLIDINRAAAVVDEAPMLEPPVEDIIRNWSGENTSSYGALSSEDFM